MSLVTCPECGKPVSTYAAACPACGKPMSAEAMPRHVPENELSVATVRPKVSRMHPIGAALCTLFVVGGIPLSIAAALQSVPRETLFISIFMTLVALAAFLVWWIESVSRALEVTTLRTVVRRGFLGRHTTEVLHAHVRNIQIEQGALDRMLGVGTISISSSGQGGMEIVFPGAPDPEHVRELIERHRAVRLG